MWSMQWTRGVLKPTRSSNEKSKLQNTLGERPGPTYHFHPSLRFDLPACGPDIFRKRKEKKKLCCRFI